MSLQKCLLQDWLSSKLIWIYHTITHSSYNFFWAILCNKQFFVYLQTVPIILMGISGVFKKNKHIFKFKTQTDYSKWRDVKSGLNLFDSEACLFACLRVTGFGPWISGVGNNRSSNWATTTARRYYKIFADCFTVVAAYNLFDYLEPLITQLLCSF